MEDVYIDLFGRGDSIGHILIFTKKMKLFSLLKTNENSSGNRMEIDQLYTVLLMPLKCVIG